VGIKILIMSMPATIYLYRITHIDNLEYILSNEILTAPTHPLVDPKYIGIGDTSLKGSRSHTPISLSPFGTFSDYLAFYFGKRSPMLYNIYHGFMGVTKRPQEEIIYLVSTFDELKKSKNPFVFFDGHGYATFSCCYNSESDLKNIDWNAVRAKDWFDTESDPDRKRKKQAEILIHQDYNIENLIGIGVFNESASRKVTALLSKLGVTLKVKVALEWYY